MCFRRKAKRHAKAEFLLNWMRCVRSTRCARCKRRVQVHSASVCFGFGAVLRGICVVSLSLAQTERTWFAALQRQTTQIADSVKSHADHGTFLALAFVCTRYHLRRIVLGLAWRSAMFLAQNCGMYDRAAKTHTHSHANDAVFRSLENRETVRN